MVGLYELDGGPFPPENIGMNLLSPEIFGGLTANYASIDKAKVVFDDFSDCMCRFWRDGIEVAVDWLNFRGSRGRLNHLSCESNGFAWGQNGQDDP